MQEKKVDGGTDDVCLEERTNIENLVTVRLKDAFFFKIF